MHNLDWWIVTEVKKKKTFLDYAPLDEIVPSSYRLIKITSTKSRGAMIPIAAEGVTVRQIEMSYRRVGDKTITRTVLKHLCILLHESYAFKTLLKKTIKEAQLILESFFYSTQKNTGQTKATHKNIGSQP